jgi:hypothetical protein
VSSVTYSSSGIVSSARGAETDSFFAWPAGAFPVVPGATLVVVNGRAAVLEEGASEVRAVVRVAGASAAGRVVRGRFTPAVVAGGIDCRDEVLPGDGRVAAPGATDVLRTPARLFSSPDGADCSVSDAADLEANGVLLGAETGAGRVGGFFKLDPAVLTREVDVAGGFDADGLEARTLLAAATGRRTPAVVVAFPVPAVRVDRRGADSFAAAAAFEAILRRTDDVGVEGAGSFLRCGLAAIDASTSLVGPSMAGACSGRDMYSWKKLSLAVVWIESQLEGVEVIIPTLCRARGADYGCAKVMKRVIGEDMMQLDGDNIAILLTGSRAVSCDDIGRAFRPGRRVLSGRHDANDNASPHSSL